MTKIDFLVLAKPSHAMLRARSTIARRRVTVAKNCSFAERVVRESAALVLIISRETLKNLHRQW